MAKGLELRIVPLGDGMGLRLEVHDEDLVGKRAEIRLLRIAEVKRSSGVDKRETLHAGHALLRRGVQDMELRLTRSDLFHYAGEQLHLRLLAQAEVDDGLLFDTEVELDARQLGRLPPRSKPKAPGKEVHSPSDRFRFWANLSAIPPKARIIVLWLMFLGLPVIAANAVLGVHDQFVPESRALFYDHSGSDGEGESPLFKALAGSGALGLGLWMAIRHQLKKYMRFEVRWGSLPQLRRGARVSVAELIDGESRVALQQAMVRVVAYNREHGQYKDTEKDGDRTRTVIKDFSHDAGGVVLFQQLLVHVPAGAKVASALDGEVDFTPLFDALHPPIRIDGSHGLSICLEAQLLHPEFIDQDGELAEASVQVKDFFASEGERTG